MGPAEVDPVTQDRPNADELLDSVAEYLFGELRPEVPREQRFKVLVAANVCAVVAREIRAGGGPVARASRCLPRFSGSPPGEFTPAPRGSLARLPPGGPETPT